MSSTTAKTPRERRRAATLTVACCVGLLAACGSGDGTTDELRPASEANDETDRAKAVEGVVGEPADLNNSFEQHVVTVRSMTVRTDPEHGRLLVVDVRAENRTDNTQNAPEFELWCGDIKTAFYGGTYDWDTMPAETFIEGTRDFEYPEPCASPEVRAVPLISTGESVRWAVPTDQ